MQNIIPENFNDAKWHKVSDGVYVFGVKDKARTQRGSETVVVDDKFAIVKRRKNGSFEYKLNQTDYSGLEPDKETAIRKVNQLYSDILKIKKSVL